MRLARRFAVNLGLCAMAGGVAGIVAAADGPDTAAALAACRRVEDAAARLACYDRIEPRAPAAGPGRPKAAPMAAAPSRAPVDFGLPAKAPADEVEAIESTLADEPGEWRPGARLRLGNGQVWQVVDGSSGHIPPGTRKVVVRRGALGSFHLEFEGLNHSPRVRRVQ